VRNSEQTVVDNSGKYAKFNCPTVSNGKVYLATFSNKLMVYGLRNTGDTCTSSVNIALNKPVYASTVAPGLPASAACDGTLCTRWGSWAADPQWIYVDLGARYDLCRVVVRWEVALGQNFNIQVSDDATNWTTIDSITGNVNRDDYLPLQGSGRYVRMYGTVRGTPFGYSIWEFEVYGKKCGAQCVTPSKLKASAIFGNAATIHWKGNGTSAFNVQYKATTDSNWRTMSADTNFVALSGLSCATNYLFRVQSICNGTDTGNYSPSSGFCTLSCTSTSASNDLCPGGNDTLSVNLSGITYQWQSDTTGNGFANISDNNNYTGTNTANLQLTNIPSSWYGYQYRCVVDTLNSSSFILTFKNTWAGAADTSWENPANWSCGELPDANTDVIINSGTVIVSSNPNVRSLTLGTGVIFTISPNSVLTINH
jgi:hypothetical protein